MGYLRLFRRIEIAPGLTMNISKHGASISAGVRGAHVTVGRTGLRRTVGIPGTGVFYTSHTGLHSGVHTGQHFHTGAAAPPTGPPTRNALVLLILCTFPGPFGVYRIYAGRFVGGLIMLALMLTVVGAIIAIPWWIVEWIMVACGQFHDAHGNRISW